ncbi:MAG: hypothetical protein NZ693_06515, partial [Thermoflexales bacterium]|nr:hypothetical protein [Thermoflexales bacterium]
QRVRLRGDPGRRWGTCQGEPALRRFAEALLRQFPYTRLFMRRDFTSLEIVRGHDALRAAVKA